MIDKFDIVAIVGQLCGGGRVKGQLVAQNIAFLDKQIGQLIFGRCGFSSRRFWITSLVLDDERETRVWKRPWILEKS